MRKSVKRQHWLLRASALGVAAALALSALGCEDKGKISEKAAASQIPEVVKTVDEDVAELERGLPLGAEKAAAIFYKAGDPRDDLGQVRKGLAKVQREVPDLTAAKSTFFALLDDKGRAIRNNLDTDVMGGRELFGMFPGLDGAASAPMARAVGLFPEARVDRAALDAGSGVSLDPTWIAASAVRDNGKIVGYLATGWSFRRFAYHLQESLRTAEKTKLVDKSDAKLAILYVAVFDEAHVYTAPQTPAVNEEALEKLGLFGKTEGATPGGVLELEGRPFGWAAARAPKWGPKLGVVLLRSEV